MFGRPLRGLHELHRGSATDVLTVVDSTRVEVDADDVVVFLLTYEGCCALDAQNASLAETALPQAIAWRAKRADEATPTSSQAPPIHLTTTTAAHRAHVARVHACKEYLLDGVIYQANLAHALSVDHASRDEARAFFEARRASVACAAFLDIDGYGCLVSLSPERFVDADLAAGTAHTYPIKGTIPRTSPIEQLLASEKDRAEHVMIVDLLRNDLGKLAVTGGVCVESLMPVVATNSVWHLESRISAKLHEGVGVRALMEACAPGGSITGAPKSTAIEVIAALEDGPRGAYTGVLGMVDARGALRTSLLIRTWMCPTQGPGSLHVGGAIVVDSDAEAEWQETIDKARAFGDVTVVG